MSEAPQALPCSTALVELGRRLVADDYRFITPTPLTHQRVNERAANQTAASLRDVFGWSRPFPPSLLPAEELAELTAAGIVAPHEQGFISRVRWSSLGDLTLVHSAFPTTEEDSVFFGPDTYRFAQSIRDQLSKTFAPIKRAVDIGCGSGAGALVIASAHPHAQVLAVDINPKALHFARVNAEVAGRDNVECLESDILQGVQGQLDLIVANPPYMKDARHRAYRHGGDALGADLSVRILRESLPRLSAGGALVLYTGVAILEGVDPFFAAVAADIAGPSWAWTYRELDPDVFGEELLEDGYQEVERIAAVELVVRRI
ncbi:MAG TPA: class I SAM-dependent methyltransferase [Pseudomonas sp.]